MRANFEKINYPYNPDKLRADLRSYPQKACDYINYLAEEAGAENERFVKNTLSIIKGFPYNSSLIDKQVGMVEQRLSRRIREGKRGQGVLPGAEIFKEGVKLGILADNPKQRVNLSLEELNMNTFISGKTGEGKTNIIFNMVPQLIRKKIFTFILDFKLEPEYRDLLQLPECSNMAVLPIKRLDKDNIFDPQGEDINEWNLFIWDILRQSYDIKQPTQIMLINYCKRLYQKRDIFCLGDLQNFLEEELSNQALPKSEKNKIHTCLKTISVILLDAGSMLDCKKGYSFKEIFEKFDSVSYELTNVSEKGRQWIVKFKLRRLNQVLNRIRRMNRLNMVLIIDEAKMLLGKKAFQSRHLDYIKQLFTQGRGAFGLGWVISDQSYTSELADFVLENIETHICLKHSLRSQIKDASFVIGCDTSEILELHKPFILMRKSNWQYHFKVWVPKSRISRHVTATEIDRLMKEKLARLSHIPGQTRRHRTARLIAKTNTKPHTAIQNEPKISPIITIKKNPLEDLERFLKYISNNPDANLTTIYKALRFSGRKGDDIKNKAIDNELVKEKTSHTGRRGRPVIELELTNKGREYINEKQQS